MQAQLLEAEGRLIESEVCTYMCICVCMYVCIYMCKYIHMSVYMCMLYLYM
jgi:hypothetical protein